MQFEVPAPSVAVSGSDQRFPVHRIYCIGRNYAEHVREMGNDPEREPPIFFLKPADTIVSSGSIIPYPPRTEDLHHEIELVVAIGKGGTEFSVENALACVFGYAAGIDLTRRDLQAAAKKKGRRTTATRQERGLGGAKIEERRAKSGGLDLDGMERI